MPYKDKKKKIVHDTAYHARPDIRARDRLRNRLRCKTPQGDAKRIRERNYAKRCNDATAGREQHYRKWTPEEITLIWDASKTTAEIAAILHRSFRAILSARTRLKRTMPFGYVHNGNRADLCPMHEKRAEQNLINLGG